jgi:hypothetical protein
VTWVGSEQRERAVGRHLAVLREASYAELLHPRDRVGRWRIKLGVAGKKMGHALDKALGEPTQMQRGPVTLHDLGIPVTNLAQRPGKIKASLRRDQRFFAPHFRIETTGVDEQGLATHFPEPMHVTPDADVESFAREERDKVKAKGMAVYQRIHHIRGKGPGEQSVVHEQGARPRAYRG